MEQSGCDSEPGFGTGQQEEPAPEEGGERRDTLKTAQALSAPAGGRVRSPRPSPRTAGRADSARCGAGDPSRGPRGLGEPLEGACSRAFVASDLSVDVGETVGPAPPLGMRRSSHGSQIPPPQAQGSPMRQKTLGQTPPHPPAPTPANTEDTGCTLTCQPRRGGAQTFALGVYGGTPTLRARLEREKATQGGGTPPPAHGWLVTSLAARRVRADNTGAGLPPPAPAAGAPHPPHQAVSLETSLHHHPPPPTQAAGHPAGSGDAPWGPVRGRNSHPPTQQQRGAPPWLSTTQEPGLPPPGGNDEPTFPDGAECQQTSADVG